MQQQCENACARCHAASVWFCLLAPSCLQKHSVVAFHALLQRCSFSGGLVCDTEVRHWQGFRALLQAQWMALGRSLQRAGM